MRKYLLLALLTTILSANAAVHAQTTSKAKDAIQIVNQSFSDSFARGDIDGLINVYTKDAQILPPGNNILTGHTAIHKFWSGASASGLIAAELKMLELEILGDTATEIGQYTLKNTKCAVAEKGKYIVIWKKIGQQWKWHRDIWNATSSSE